MDKMKLNVRQLMKFRIVMEGMLRIMKLYNVIFNFFFFIKIKLRLSAFQAIQKYLKH